MQTETHSIPLGVREHLSADQLMRLDADPELTARFEANRIAASTDKRHLCRGFDSVGSFVCYQKFFRFADRAVVA